MASAESLVPGEFCLPDRSRTAQKSAKRELRRLFNELVPERLRDAVYGGGTVTNTSLLSLRHPQDTSGVQTTNPVVAVPPLSGRITGLRTPPRVPNGLKSYSPRTSG